MNSIYQIIKIEALQDFKNRYVLSGYLLYLVAVSYVIFLSITSEVSRPVWVALYWITLIFGSINALMKSFYKESKGLALYYHMMASPRTIILAKMIYNLFTNIVIAFVNFGLFTLFLGNPFESDLRFIYVIVMGASGIACLLTFMSAISSKTDQAQTSMAILSLPLLIPLLISLVNLSLQLNMPVMQETGYIWLIPLGLNFVIFSLAVLLFPYLWTE
jgi:heme exporter protein B